MRYARLVESDRWHRLYPSELGADMTGGAEGPLHISMPMMRNA